jgi:shikimate kinase
MAEVIDWIVEYLKSQYGVPNVIRFSKETEQPAASNLTDGSANSQRTVTAEGDSMRVTLSIDDNAGDTGAVAPVSPTQGNEGLVETV